MKYQTLTLPVAAIAFAAAATLSFAGAANAKPLTNSFKERPATCSARMHVLNGPSNIILSIKAFNPQNGESGVYGPVSVSNSGWGELYFFIFYGGLPALCTGLDCDTIYVNVSPPGAAELPSSFVFECN